MNYYTSRVASSPVQDTDPRQEYERGLSFTPAENQTHLLKSSFTFK